MSQNISIRQFIINFSAGKYDAPDVGTQIDAGWYDWFCKDKSLAKKTQKLGKKLIQVSISPKINQDTMYVFFKNNCPMNGNLYDDFRICDMETDKVIFTICPKSGHTFENGNTCVWDGVNAKELKFESWRKFVDWFNQ